MNNVKQDLNLLKVLVCVGETLNLKKAGEVLNLSQPSLSYLIKKLRQDFSDPLFIKNATGFMATPKAISLIPEARRILADSKSLYEEKTFDLKTHQATITLAMSTYFEALVLVPLMAKINQQAPQVKLRTVSLNDAFPKNELESGDFDLAIAAYFRNLPPNFFLQSLDKDEHVVVVRKGHPLVKSEGTLDDYLSFSHIKIAVPLKTLSRIDEALLTRKLERKILGEFNNFLTPMMMVQNSDCVLTIPKRLAQVYKSLAGLVILDLPMRLAPIESQMVWHSRLSHDPLARWIRSEIKSIYAGTSKL